MSGRRPVRSRLAPRAGADCRRGAVGDPSWLRVVLAPPLGGEGRYDVDEQQFHAVLPLLRHQAFEGEGPPPQDPALSNMLPTLFQGGARRFLDDARRIAPEAPIMFRRGLVGLRSGNPMTARFVPPPAERVPAALRLALSLTDRALACDRMHVSQKALSIVLATHVLLTIHPFPDGNGRVTRMFCAASVLRHIGPAPSAILALVVMQHHAGAQPFHQALWSLRRGDVDPLAALYLRARQLAMDWVLDADTRHACPSTVLERCWDNLMALR